MARLCVASYPDKPIKILVGYQAGGPTDLTARVIATKLQASLGQPFIVENRPGAGSNIASEQLAAAAPDGYTLLVAAAPMTWNSVLYRHVKFDPVKSFAPVVKVMTAPPCWSLPQTSASTAWPNSSHWPRRSRAGSPSARPAMARPSTWQVNSRSQARHRPDSRSVQGRLGRRSTT